MHIKSQVEVLTVIFLSDRHHSRIKRSAPRGVYIPKSLETIFLLLSGVLLKGPWYPTRLHKAPQVCTPYFLTTFHMWISGSLEQTTTQNLYIVKISKAKKMPKNELKQTYLTGFWWEISQKSIKLVNFPSKSHQIGLIQVIFGIFWLHFFSLMG